MVGQKVGPASELIQLLGVKVLLEDVSLAGDEGDQRQPQVDDGSLLEPPLGREVSVRKHLKVFARLFGLVLLVECNLV